MLIYLFDKLLKILLSWKLEHNLYSITLNMYISLGGKGDVFNSILFEKVKSWLDLIFVRNLVWKIG
jgi:hypothetical protein